MTTDPQSMLDFYRSQYFNPVLIPVEEAERWEDHRRKRENLYERHLGIPLGLLSGKRILEFGCNSGENALVLAAVGARLTLSEPNLQVHPRLHDLFRRFGLDGQIDQIRNDTFQEFAEQGTYHLVLGEGFLYTLPLSLSQILERLARFMTPGGICVIAYSDRYGMFVEWVRRSILWRVYELLGIADPLSTQALAVARELFAEDFSRIPASRPFEA